VDDAGFSSEARTLVYLEPSLLSTHWPQLLRGGTWSDISAHLVPDATGANSLTVGKFLGAGERVGRVSPDGATLATGDDVVPDGSNPFQVASSNLDGQPGAETLTPQLNFIHAIRPDGSTSSFPAPAGHYLDAAVPVVTELDDAPGPEVLAVATDFYYGT